ncbi:MAG TPA: SprT-like domain-containing protein [Gemmatimonadales bacterium]|nr:SprT-like domain-containing protein [Gemmatimonadales bacterium]
MTSLALEPDDVLAERLAALGWKTPSKISTHDNRTVLVSLTPTGELRVHRGYAFASDRVLRAILRFVTPTVRRDVRAAARRELLAFPVELHVPSRDRRPNRPRPEDEAIIRRLEALHHELNDRYFGGELDSVALRLSSRMRRRLGDIAISNRTGRATEITISRRHLRADGWKEVTHTLLHEMVHQWQAEHGHRVDHGRTFREKARDVGIRPAAERHVSR